MNMQEQKNRFWLVCLMAQQRMQLAEYPASFICEPDNIQQIKENIIKIFELYRKNELPTVDDEFLTKYRRDYLTEQLTKQFQFLIRASVI